MKRTTTILSIAALVIMIIFSMICVMTTASAEELDDFGTSVSTNLPTSGAYNFITVGDVNGDQNMDIAFGGNDYGSYNTLGIEVYTGNGAGTWTSASTGLPTVDSWGGIALADADEDGNMELYGANTWYNSASGPNKGVGAWEYSGGSWSTTGITSPVTSGVANNLLVANITGGPGLDIAVCSSKQPSFGLAVYSGSGSSPISWTSFSNGLPSSGQFTGIDVIDLNDDGSPDIAAAGYYSSTGMRVYTQGASGWTDVSSTLPTAAYTGDFTGVACGDLNNDGHVDMVYCDRYDGMEVLLGNSGGAGGSSFTWTTPTSTNGGMASSGTNGMFSQIDLTDIDGDGDLDLIAAKESSGLHLYLGDGSTSPGTGFSFTEVSDKGLPTSGTYYGSQFFDMDGDGDKDIAGASWGSGIKVYETKFATGSLPVADAGDDQGIVLGNTVNLDGTASCDAEDCPSGDAVGSLLIYDWGISSQPAGSTMTDANLSPSDAAAKPSLVPTHEGTYTLTLRVQDSDLGWSSVSDTVDIVVTAANTVPTANAGSDQTVYIGASVTLNGSASTDAEDAMNALTFDWNVSASNPAAVSLSSESAMMPTFPAPDTTGTYTFSLVVKDTSNAWSVEDEVSITVEVPPNVKPTANAGPDISGYPNTKIYLDGSDSVDTDGSIVVWDWNCTSHASLAITDKDTYNPFFTPTTVGTYTFTLTVKDDRGAWALEDEVVVNIIQDNTPPTPNAGTDLQAYVNTVVYLDGANSTDPEGSIAGWEWVCTSYSLTLTNANSSAPSFTPTETGTYTFSLRVMDDLDLWSTGTETVIVIVIDRPNIKPIAAAGADVAAEVGDTVSLDGTGSSDSDGTIVSWEWNCTTHPSLSIIDEVKETASFKATEAGTYVFTLVVKDEDGAWSATDTMTVTVKAQEPVIENTTDEPNGTEDPPMDQNPPIDDGDGEQGSDPTLLYAVIGGVVAILVVCAINVVAIVLVIIMKRKKDEDGDDEEHYDDDCEENDGQNVDWDDDDDDLEFMD